ncbi:diacylglycerol/lipid kinase family protein [Sphingorhabdus pulchriflava]|nr:diacylglycerol kinase family protein [Sphingorhabdus pulchriflava]
MARMDQKLTAADCPRDIQTFAPDISLRPRVQIVCNPEAGGYSAKRLALLGDAYARHGFDVIVSESSPISPFVAAEGVDRICISGGDGTVRHVLENAELRTAGVAVDIYPTGTINLLAREWKDATQPGAFVRVMVQRCPRKLYPVRLNDTSFLACASVGPDARAVASLSPALKRRIGRLAYAVSMARQFVNWQRPQLRVVVDGEPMDCEAVYLAKGHYYAGPWSFAPEARLDNPDLYIVTLRRARRRDFAVFLLAMLVGRVGNLDNVRTIKGRDVKIDSVGALPLQADGDIACMTPARLVVADEPVLI